MTNPKLPALTSADIEALPPGYYHTTFGPLAITAWGDLNMVQFQGHSLTPQQAVERDVVVTARLVDPAPLVELLEKARAIIDKGLHGMPSNGFQGEAQAVLDDLEAALEGNDG